MIATPEQLDTLKTFERLALPFKHFKNVFKAGSIYTKIVMVLQCILLTSGPLLFGQIELGLILSVVFAGLLFFFIFITRGYFLPIEDPSRININAFTYIVIAVILLATLLLILYSTFRMTVNLADERNDGHVVFKSIIYEGIKKLVNSIKNWFKEFGIQFSVGDKKCKTLLVLSFFTFGIPLIVFGQVVKGLALFLVQAVGILYLIARGVADLQNFFILHADKKYNSVLVYGVIALVVVAMLIFMYIVSLSQTVKAADDYNKKRLGSNFKKQVYELADKNFYITSLFIPVVGALVFTVIPLIFMIFIAFSNYSNVSAPGYNTSRESGFLDWVGMETFRRLFSNSANLQDLLSVFSWTMIWALLATFSCYFGGLLLALLVNKKSIKIKPLWRSIFVISMAMPQFVSLLVMRTFLDNYGPLPTLLQNIGLIADAGTLDLWKQEFSARALIIFINMWVGIPYYMLLMSGLLINIPKDYYEAAKIAGASRAQQFKRITFPNILFMTTPMLITSFVNNINNFNVIWFLTQGGPANDEVSGTAGKTDILITWLYQLTQKTQDFNFGAAIGIIMFVITAVLSLVIFRRSSSYKNEEAYR